MISYILAPNPTTQFTDNLGEWLVQGKLYTYDWDTRLPKATYYDPQGTERPNPIVLDSVGRQYAASQPIYWADDAPYYLVLKDMDDQEIWQSAYPFYPGSGQGKDAKGDKGEPNLIINGQMRFYPTETITPIPANIPILANGGWSYSKNGTNASTSLTFVRYSLDNTAIDADPVFCLRYISTSAGTNETINNLIFRLQDVKTLAGEKITVSWNVKSNILGAYTLVVNAVQNFGTGGAPSPSVTTNVMSIAPTNNALDYSATITLPTTVGKTLGTNGDDSLELHFIMPLNINANIEMTNFYLKRGNPLTEYPYISFQQTDAYIISQYARRWFLAESSGASFGSFPDFQIIPMNTVPADDLNWFNLSISAWEPKQAGLYIFSATMNMSTSAPQEIAVTFVLNAGGLFGSETKNVNGSTLFTFSGLIYLQATNAVRVAIRGQAASFSVSSASFTGTLIVN